jgi:hypothetical protein
MQKYYSSVESRVLHFATVFSEHHRGVRRKRLASLKSGVRASSLGWINLQ